MPYNFTTVEKKWQRYWLEHKSFRAFDSTDNHAAGMPKAYVLDMFPYPSGAGLHVGHLMNELVNGDLVVAPDGSIHVNPVQEGMERISGEVRTERLWRELSGDEQVDVINAQRLAYMDEVPVNWCPGLGTVLSNEEVIDGKSERGGFPVERRPMRQWLLRITAYAERLMKDLDLLDWPESLKEMQRNWIGKSVGAEVDFDVAPPERPFDVNTVSRAREIAEDE